MDVQFLSFYGLSILIYPAVVHLVPILHDPLNDHIWTSAGRPIMCSFGMFLSDPISFVRRMSKTDNKYKHPF